MSSPLDKVARELLLSREIVSVAAFVAYYPFQASRNFCVSIGERSRGRMVKEKISNFHRGTFLNAGSSHSKVEISYVTSRIPGRIERNSSWETEGKRASTQGRTIAIDRKRNHADEELEEIRGERKETLEGISDAGPPSPPPSLYIIFLRSICAET